MGEGWNQEINYVILIMWLWREEPGPSPSVVPHYINMCLQWSPIDFRGTQNLLQVLRGQTGPAPFSYLAWESMNLSFFMVFVGIKI